MSLFLKLWTMLVSFFTVPKQEVALAEGMGLRPFDLQFFAADPEPGDTDPNPNPDPPADPKPNEHMIPKSRFDEVNNNYKTVKDQLDKILKQQEQEDLESKKKQGEFEKLYNETNEQLGTYKNNYESTKSRVEVLEGIMNSMLNTKLESIPEEFHDLIPENLSPEQKLDWITKAETKGLFGSKKSDEPVGGPTNPGPQNTDFEKMNPMQLLSAGYGSKK